MRQALFSIVIAALSAPAKRASNIDDATVLNFALTLEHLENAFYGGALAKFDQQAFLNAGLPTFARGRFAQVADHEKTHVKFLSDALGAKATKPCTYNFPYTDPKSFAALSQILEGVGTSAYTGAAQLITNKDYLTAAASVLATEARHASWVASAVNKFAGWSGAFDVPLSLNQVYTLAAGFITSCPSSNPALPVHAFPALTLSNPVPGKKSKTVAPKSSTGTPTFIAFFSGLDKTFVPITNGEVAVPEGLSGQVYAMATTSGTEATDDTIVAGPAILLFERDSNGNLISS
ncbi:ferritin-like domain-containing protein [Flammula alnicola]|nr:ferritin-like domain-containing protein [Flammula alnicola]